MTKTKLQLRRVITVKPSDDSRTRTHQIIDTRLENGNSSLSSIWFENKVAPASWENLKVPSSVHYIMKSFELTQLPRPLTPSPRTRMCM